MYNENISKELPKKDFLGTLLYVLITFPLIGENILETVFGNQISKMLSVFSCVMILLIIIKTKKIKLNAFLVLMLFLIIQKTFIFLFLKPTGLEINNRNNMITPYGLIGYFMLFLLIETSFKDGRKSITVFKSMTIVMSISILLNLILTGDLHFANNISTFKEALATGYTNSRKWLFGHRNMIFIHHLMWIGITFMYYKLSDKKYTKILFIQLLITFMVGIISWNSTMLLVTLLLCVILYLKKNKLFKKLSMKNFFIIFLFIEIGIVFFRIQNWFSFLIVDILHRNLSFTGRVYIWNSYIREFSNSNILNKLLGNFGVTNQLVNTHNMFLGLIVYSGLIGFGIYFTLILVTIRKLNKNKDNDMAIFLSVVYFAFLINSITMEFYLQPLIIMYMAYNIERFKTIENNSSTVSDITISKLLVK